MPKSVFLLFEILYFLRPNFWWFCTGRQMLNWVKIKKTWVYSGAHWFLVSRSELLTEPINPDSPTSIYLQIASSGQIQSHLVELQHQAWRKIRPLFNFTTMPYAKRRSSYSLSWIRQNSSFACNISRRFPKYCFYRTQTFLGSDLWVSVFLFNYQFQPNVN